jgi:uncharacterized protein Yka (UPF0111/DUF47 family)
MIPTKQIKVLDYNGKEIEIPVALVKNANEVIRLLRKSYFDQNDFDGIAKETDNTPDEIHDFAMQFNSLQSGMRCEMIKEQARNYLDSLEK